MNAWWAAVLGAGLVLLPALVSIFSLRWRNQGLDHDLRAERDRADAASRQLGFLTALGSSFIDQASAAMLLVDANRRVTYFNAAAVRLFAIKADMVEGKTLIELAGDHDLDSMVRRVLAGSLSEQLEVRPPGTERVLQAIARRVISDEGEFRGVALVVEDVTELHRADTMRRDLVANVSHELRTPIAAIKAMVETLQSGALEDRELTLDFLAKINHELDSTTLLIRDLLELSRIESGHLALEIDVVDARDIVRETVNRMQPAAEQAGLTLEHIASGRLDVPTDRRRASQILTNLVENAIKFTPTGTVKVRLRKLDSEACISVEDTGMGIGEADLPRVFERFYKADKARSRQDNPGTGLGLSIAKHLAQALGGRIWAESREGKGSTFCFTLPLAGGGQRRATVRRPFGAEDMALRRR